MVLGGRIEAARKRAGLTQSVLAQRVGLAHPQSISNYERGKDRPDLARLHRIAEATGEPISYFVEADEPVWLADVQAMGRQLDEIRDLLKPSGPTAIEHMERLVIAIEQNAQTFPAEFRVDLQVALRRLGDRLRVLADRLSDQSARRREP